MKDVIEFSIVVKANAMEVWHALTDSDELENWWGEGVKIEPKVGGQFREKWEDDEGNAQLATGKILSMKIKKEITFTWREKDWPKEANTKCTFQIEADSAHKSTLTLFHTGWETLPEALRKNTYKDFTVGWTYHLKELKAYLDE